MNTLALVEVQSLMHALDSKSLLALALCNKRLLSDASSEYSWKYCDLYSFTWTNKCQGMALAYFKSLGRYRQIKVKWRSDSAPEYTILTSIQPEEDEMLGLLKLKNVASLVCERQASVEQYTRVFTALATSFPHLTELVLNESRHIPPNFCDLLLTSAPPTLTSLQIACRLEHLQDERLLALPDLTIKSLHYAANSQEGVSREGYDATYEHLPLASIARCTQLTELTLRGPTFHQEDWMVRFFTTLQSPRLQKLTIHSFHTMNGSNVNDKMRKNVISTEEYIAIFTSPVLQHLTTLQLTDTYGLDMLLPLLIYLPTLEHLILSSSHAAPKVIQELLEATSVPSSSSSSHTSRTCDLRITFTWCFYYYLFSIEPSPWTLKEFRALEKEMRGRFVVIEP